MDILIYDQEYDAWRPGQILAVRKGIEGAEPWDGKPINKENREFLLVWCKKVGSLVPQTLIESLVHTDEVESTFNICKACGHIRGEHYTDKETGMVIACSNCCECSLFINQKE